MDRLTQSQKEDRIEKLEARVLTMHLALTFILSVIGKIRRLIDPDIFGKIHEAESRAFASLNHGPERLTIEALRAAKELAEIYKNDPRARRISEALAKVDWITKIPERESDKVA